MHLNAVYQPPLSTKQEEEDAQHKQSQQWRTAPLCEQLLHDNIKILDYFF